MEKKTKTAKQVSPRELPAPCLPVIQNSTNISVFLLSFVARTERCGEYSASLCGAFIIPNIAGGEPHDGTSEEIR